MINSKIAIFASGKGSNALNLIRHFEAHASIQVKFVLSNKSDAAVLLQSEDFGIPAISFSNAEVENGDFMTKFLADHAIDFIILAGYLRKIPAAIIAQFTNRIINIHPSLLPKFGGAGMYGKHVHEAVLLSQEKETGITIHFVDENFDSGQKIAQFYCALSNDETVETIQHKVRELEQIYFPAVVEKTILKTKNV